MPISSVREARREDSVPVQPSRAMGAWDAQVPTAEAKLYLLALVEADGDRERARRLVEPDLSDAQVRRVASWLAAHGYIDDDGGPLIAERRQAA